MDRVHFLDTDSGHDRPDRKRPARLQAMLASKNETLERGLSFIHPDLRAGFDLLHNVCGNHVDKNKAP